MSGNAYLAFALRHVCRVLEFLGLGVVAIGPGECPGLLDSVRSPAPFPVEVHGEPYP
jgi:hypothetical protein